MRRIRESRCALGALGHLRGGKPWWVKSGSPKVQTLIRGQVELVARFHVECRVPLVDVGQWPVDPHPRNGVASLRKLVAHRILAEPSTPALRPAEEEALIASQ